MGIICQTCLSMRTPPVSSWEGKENEEKVLMPGIIYLKTWWKDEGQKLLETSGSLTLSPADWSAGIARLVSRCSPELWSTFDSQLPSSFWRKCFRQRNLTWTWSQWIRKVQCQRFQSCGHRKSIPIGRWEGCSIPIRYPALWSLIQKKIGDYCFSSW